METEINPWDYEAVEKRKAHRTKPNRFVVTGPAPDPEALLEPETPLAVLIGGRAADDAERIRQGLRPRKVE